MTVSLRRLLACLLLVALPWQGVAAAAMVLCQPVSQAWSSGDNGHGAHASGTADPAAHHVQHHDAHALDDAAGGHGLQADADHQCGACSWCGHALALPGMPVALHAPPALQGPLPGATPPVGSRVAPLPDKPPRA